MSAPGKKKATLKERVIHEVVEYWLNVAYLTVVFAAFTQYRRFLLAAHDITYTNYGIAVIQALILAKVIMIGDAVRLGRGLEREPLIYPTLYKTFVFAIFVGVFKIIEHAIKGLWAGTGLTGILAGIVEKGPDEILANSLIIFVAFIPFFAIKELGRVLGEDRLRTLFFRRRADQGSGSSG